MCKVCVKNVWHFWTTLRKNILHSTYKKQSYPKNKEVHTTLHKRYTLIPHKNYINTPLNTPYFSPLYTPPTITTNLI
jgi:hypothetical protein